MTTKADIAALEDFTNAEMVKLYRKLIVDLGAAGPEGQVVGPFNHAYTLRDLRQVQETLKHFEAKAAEDADAATITTTGCPVVQYQEPQT